jgi:putative SOS response-associated peptidase YedK
MCGRITQYKHKLQYPEEMGWREYRSSIAPPLPTPYNVPPGTSVYVMDCLDGGPRFDPMPWGHHSTWARDKKIPMAANATIEKAKSPYWRGLWKNGRVIVPADGWYEWTGPKGNKQPWYIKRRDGGSLFLAAVSSCKPSIEEQAYGAGFAMVTADAFGGMVDVHDRRPIVLSAEDAKVWLDLEWSAEQAEQIARECALPAEDFIWYQVTRAVNKSGNDSPEFIVPIDEPE